MTHSQLVRTSLLALFTAMVLPVAAQGQQLTETPAVTVAAPAAAVVAPTTVAPVGPVIQQTQLVRAAVRPNVETLNLQGAASDRDASWMIIGGAALVVGSLVDGDAGTIIMVTGAVIGLMGLWRYLQ